MTPQTSVDFMGRNEALQVGVNTGNINFNHKNIHDKCLSDLRLTNPRDDKERIKETKGGLERESYKWILDQSDFQKWRDDDEVRLLWIKGDPGKGKTMLLIGIVEELERQLIPVRQAEESTCPTVLSYFFCQGIDSNMNNATAVLRGLIYLLAVQQPSLASNLRKEYEQSSSKLFNDNNAFVALSNILMTMLLNPTLGRAYLVIDALDECETGLQQLLKIIVDSTSASRAKWIISSRNKHEIGQQLKLDSQMKLSLELKANAEYVSRAVNTYINIRVSRLDSLEDNAARDEVGHILRQKAAGTFLWVALVIEELRNVPSWDVLDILEEMPTGLEELYARMMKQIQGLSRRNPDYCRLMLSTTALAYRPLHILELGVLAGLPEKISSKAQNLRDLVSLCGSFLTLREDRVYIIHQSAKDYLMSDKAASAIFPIGSTQVHRDISLRSLQAMMSTIRRDIYRLRHPGVYIADLQIPDPDPLKPIRYSCIHWVDHIYEARQRNDLLDGGPAHEFLEGYFLYWTEASSLLGALPDAMSAVQNLEKVLKSMFSESRLLSLAVEAHRFLLHNGSIIKNAPLQTYVSAFLFSPNDSLMREVFKKERPQWVLTAPIVGKNWSLLVKTLEGHSSGVRSVAFSSDGKLIVSGSDNNVIKIWEMVTGEVKYTLDCHGSGVMSIAFSLNGRLIASPRFRATGIHIWDAVTGEVKQRLHYPSNEICSGAFSPDRRLIAFGSYDDSIRIWDLATGEVKHTLRGYSSRLGSIIFSSNEELVAFGSDRRPLNINIWNVATGRVSNVIMRENDCLGRYYPHFIGPRAVLSPNGKLIASWEDFSTEINVWEAATGQVKQTLKGHRNGVRSCAFSQDGKLIAFASKRNTIRVCDTITGEVKHTLEGHSSSIWQIVFSPDGKFIASGSDDSTIKVWDAASVQVETAIEGHRTVHSDDSVGTPDKYPSTNDINKKEDACPYKDADDLIRLESQGAPQYGYSLNLEKSWITWNGNRVIWLPPEYRPSKRPRSVIWLPVPPPSVARVAITCDSGRVIVIGFSKSPSGLS